MQSTVENPDDDKGEVVKKQMSPIMRNAIEKDKKSIMDGKEMSDLPHLNIDMAIVSQVVGKHRQGESPKYESSRCTQQQAKSKKDKHNQ